VQRGTELVLLSPGQPPQNRHRRGQLLGGGLEPARIHQHEGAVADDLGAGRALAAAGALDDAPGLFVELQRFIEMPLVGARSADA
jgi:hypothetical protein